MRKLTYDDLAFYSRHGYKVKRLFGKFYLLRRYSVNAVTKVCPWDLVILEDWK